MHKIITMKITFSWKIWQTMKILVLKNLRLYGSHITSYVATLCECLYQTTQNIRLCCYGKVKNVAMYLS